MLDRMGISAQWRLSGEPQTVSRQVGMVSVVDLQGRITVGEGNILLRQVISSLLETGRKKIVLNFLRVGYIDSSGLGELVRTHTTLHRQGGQLKIINLNPKVQELLEATRLHRVFDVCEDEASAIKSFGPFAAAVSA